MSPLPLKNNDVDVMTKSRDLSSRGVLQILVLKTFVISWVIWGSPMWECASDPYNPNPMRGHNRQATVLVQGMGGRLDAMAADSPFLTRNWFNWFFWCPSDMRNDWMRIWGRQSFEAIFKLSCPKSSKRRRDSEDGIGDAFRDLKVVLQKLRFGASCCGWRALRIRIRIELH